MSKDERLEMKVDHLVKVIQEHKLSGVCPGCGEKIETNHVQAIKMFEEGATRNDQCPCGQKLSVPGRSKLVTAGDQKIVVPELQRVNGKQVRPRPRMPKNLVKGA